MFAKYILLGFLHSSLAKVQLGEQFEEFDAFYQKSLEDEVIDQHKEYGIGSCMTSKRKSPIDIDPEKAILKSFPSLIFKNYDLNDTLKMSEKNNYTVTVEGYSTWSKKPILTEGFMDGEYHLMEVQLDTGIPLDKEDYYYGHTINNTKYGFEMRFIHTKNGMPIDQASRFPGGVVIVSSLINENKTEDYPIQECGFSWYRDEEFRNSEHHLWEGTQTWVTPDTFLPEERESYYTYQGTFSHPPCTGEATWLILANPITLSLRDYAVYSMNDISKSAMTNLFPRRKTHPEVYYNQPALAMNLKTWSIFLGATAVIVVIFGVIAAIYMILFFAKKKNKNTECEGNIPQANYEAGYDNINFTKDAVSYVCVETPQ